MSISWETQPTSSPCESLNKLSKRELQSLFYVGRKLRLKDCYLGAVTVNQDRTVMAQKSYGYTLLREDGKNTELRFEAGNYILGKTCGNGYYEVAIYDADGTLAVKYELL
jgi:hypothetical protein